MMNYKHYLSLLLKGVGMGAADVVPGVSGGTIAFMTGIFEELVEAINAVNMDSLRTLLRGDFRSFWKKVHGAFLLSVFSGILISVASLAKLMQYLLHNHPIQTWAFFFGLIVASSFVMLRGIRRWNALSVCMLCLGIALGVIVCRLSPTETPNDMWFVFLSGAVAICAMILPGISGSFILLILGKYKYMMDVIAGLTSGHLAENLPVLGVFGGGALCGLLTFSRVLHWLLARYHMQTMLTMAGFILGSLVKVWPWSNMEAVRASQYAHLSPEALALIPLEQVEMHYMAAAVCAMLGFLLVMGLERQKTVK